MIKSLITKLYYNINISNMSNFFLHCALRKALCLMCHLVENNKIEARSSIIYFTQTNDLKCFLFIGGWNCFSFKHVLFQKKKKSRQPNTSSLNLQYNVPKHVRNIYHVHDLFQWGACLNGNNIQKVSKAFCYNNKKVHDKVQNFRKKLYKTLPNSLRD